MTSPITHGTNSGYRRGCRCDDCRIAHRHAQVAWMRRNMTGGRQPPAHGTLNGYVNYGCRCDACRSAAREHSSRRRLRERAS